MSLRKVRPVFVSDTVLFVYTTFTGAYSAGVLCRKCTGNDGKDKPANVAQPGLLRK